MIYVYENIQDSFFNERVLDYLKDNGQWIIAEDYKTTNTEKDDSVYSDNGFTFPTYDSQFNLDVHSFLNVSAYHIFTKVALLNGYNINNLIPIRYLWNYYNRASTGIYHEDNYNYDKKYDYYSIVYYLNDNDGGTKFIIDTDSGEEKFIQSVQGRAILFPSGLLHSGVGPVQQSQRFLLNIIFRVKDENST